MTGLWGQTRGSAYIARLRERIRAHVCITLCFFLGVEADRRDGEEGEEEEAEVASRDRFAEAAGLDAGGERGVDILQGERVAQDGRGSDAGKGEDEGRGGGGGGWASRRRGELERWLEVESTRSRTRVASREDLRPSVQAR